MQRYIFFYLLIFLFSNSINAQEVKKNYFNDNFIKVDLNTSDRNYYIFFNSTKRETLRKYRKAKIKFNEDQFYEAQFRSRGIQGAHYNNSNRSIKIRLKNNNIKKFKHKKYKTLNFNSLLSDPFLRDPIAYSVWAKYNFLSLESNLAIMSVNEEFNGIKILYENLDDEFLWRNGIKNGSMYRESFAGALDSARGWLQEDYLKIWEKQSLRRHKDIDDWISFLISNSKNDTEFYKLLEKNIDINKYLKWQALNTILGGNHHVTDHNIVFFNNFEKQQFESVIYDPAGFDIYRTQETIRYFNNNFNSKILIKNEYWNKYLFYLYEILNSSKFEKTVNEAINDHYSKLKEVLMYLNKKKNLPIEEIYPVVLDKKYIWSSRPIKLDYKKCKTSQYNYDIDCIISLNKSELNHFILERKTSILKEIEEVQFFGNSFNTKTDNLKINFQNKTKLTKIISTIFLKTKTLSNNKVEEIKLLLNEFKFNKGNQFYICDDQDYNQIINNNEKCYIGKVENKYLIFDLVNDSIFLKSHLFQSNHNNHVKTSVFDYVENNYKSIEKNFIILTDATEQVFENDISFFSFTLLNQITFKKKLFEISNSKNFLLDNLDIVLGPNENRDFSINISKNKYINSFYKIKFDNKIKWANVSGNKIKLNPNNNSIGEHILEFKIFDKNQDFQNYSKKIIVKPWSRISKVLSNFDISLAKYFENNALRVGTYGQANLDLKNIFFKIKGLYYNIFNFQSYFSRRGYNLDKSIYKKDFLNSDKKIVWGPDKIINIKNTTILPINSTLEIKPGSKIIIDKKKALIFHGKVKAIGSKDKPIIFTSSNEKDNFGAIIFNHNSVNGSEFKNVIVERGKDFSWKGRLYTGALNVYNSSILIDESIFRFNAGDDAINLKYSKSIIKNSLLYSNNFDALDSDFSNLELYNNRFEDNGNDGVDLNNSVAYIENKIRMKY